MANINSDCAHNTRILRLFFGGFFIFGLGGFAENFIDKAVLNRLLGIEIDTKYSESSFLFFWRKFNTLYNIMHRSEDVKDPIEVYFDNQIGIVEVIAEESEKKTKKPTVHQHLEFHTYWYRSVSSSAKQFVGKMSAESFLFHR